MGQPWPFLGAVRPPPSRGGPFAFVIRLAMTDDQEAHLASCIGDFTREGDSKYRKGVEQHGGNLWERDPVWLIEQAMLECLDQWMYLKTARDKLKAKTV